MLEDPSLPPVEAALLPAPYCRCASLLLVRVSLVEKYCTASAKMSSSKVANPPSKDSSNLNASHAELTRPSDLPLLLLLLLLLLSLRLLAELAAD